MKNSIKYIIAGLFALVLAGQIHASIVNVTTAKCSCMPEITTPETPEENF